MPDHWIMTQMSRNRFQELHIRVRFYGNQEQGPYEKVANNPLFPRPFYPKLANKLPSRLKP